MVVNEAATIVSLEEVPERRQTVAGYCREHWPPVYGHFVRILDEVFSKKGALPLCCLLLKGEAIIGFYVLAEREPLVRTDLTPWIGCLFVDEHERGRGLSARLLEHGREAAGRFGFDRVYVTTDHIRFYEKFGFREIGLTTLRDGRPTKLYEHDTVR